MSAPVSGPGKFSQRTDGTPSQPQRDVTGLPYGDGQAFRAQQGAAPMAAAGRPASPAPSEVAGGPGPVPVSPGAPSTRPSEPVTAGAALGPGGTNPFTMRPGSAAGRGQVSRAISNVAASDPSGILAALAIEADRRGL